MSSRAGQRKKKGKIRAQVICTLGRRYLQTRSRIMKAPVSVSIIELQGVGARSITKSTFVCMRCSVAMSCNRSLSLSLSLSLAFRRVVSANFWNVLVERRPLKRWSSLRTSKDVRWFALDAGFCSISWFLGEFRAAVRKLRSSVIPFFFFLVDEYFTLIIYIRRLKFRLFDFFQRILCIRNHSGILLFCRTNISQSPFIDNLH